MLDVFQTRISPGVVAAGMVMVVRNRWKDSAGLPDLRKHRSRTHEASWYATVREGTRVDVCAVLLMTWSAPQTGVEQPSRALHTGSPLGR